MKRKPEKTTDTDKKMKLLKDEHYIGIRRIHIDRLEQAVFEKDGISSRERERPHINMIASNIIKSGLMFQSPIQANVKPDPDIPGTQSKAYFSDGVFKNPNVKFVVFGHQHFMESIQIARKWAIDNNELDLLEQLTYLDIGAWAGLDPETDDYWPTFTTTSATRFESVTSGSSSAGFV